MFMTDEATHAWEREMQDEYESRFAPMATMSDAHSEWHRNSGVPMGMPGCPQDACHIPDFPFPEETETGVRCGNTMGATVRHYHATTADVRACYDAKAEGDAWFASFKAPEPEPEPEPPSARAIEFGHIQAMSASRFD